MPVKTFLNWTMPAFVNISVGSFRGTSGLDGTCSCPFLRKKSMKVPRISLRLVIMNFHFQGLARFSIYVAAAKSLGKGESLSDRNIDTANTYKLASNRGRASPALEKKPTPNPSAF